MRILMVVVAAACLGAATPALAQPVITPAAAAPDAGFAARKALALRYMEAAGLKSTMMVMLRSMAEVDAFSNEPGLSRSEKAARQAILIDAMEAILPEYFDYVAGRYADVFTLAELQHLVTFYESDLGRSVAEKSRTLASQANESMNWLMPRYQIEIRRLVCERLGCDDEKPARAA